MRFFYGIQAKFILMLICVIALTTATGAWCANEQTKAIGEKRVIKKPPSPDSSSTASKEETLQNIHNMIDKLRFSEEQAEIFQKWSKYLESVSKYTNDDYLETIRKFGLDYVESCKKLGGCINLEDERAKQYSPLWLDNLQNKFGKEYILQNKKAIGYIVLGILSYRQNSECVESRKDAIYKEAPYIFVLHRYIKYYLEFVETLDKSEQEKIKDITEYAKSIQEIPVDPLKELLAHEAVVYALQINGIISSKKYDPELKDFLMKQPSFAKSFNIGKALKDLREYK